jgi:hypothetical protein
METSIHNMPEQIIRERMIATRDSDSVPDFTDTWVQIHKDLNGMAAGALRIGEQLKTIRDELKSRGLWLKELKNHGWSQPQASRYVRFAELPKEAREIYMQCENFSLSAAVGEPRRTKSHNTKSAPALGEISPSEREERLSEIDEQFKLVLKLVEAGERVLADDPQPEYADDPVKWQGKVTAAATAALAVLHAGLREELQKRLLVE